MRGLARYILLSIVLLASIRGIAQTPQPGPEVKKLEAFVGTWQYEGEAKASPIGPASKISGTLTARLVMNGFALEWNGAEKGAFGGVQWGEIDVYDPPTKSYPYFGYQNDGTIWSGSNVVNGNVWRATGTITCEGVSYRFRQEASFSVDGQTWTWKSEISVDGETWKAWIQGTMTKAM